MNILIVDDSKAMRMIVKRNLRQAGFEDDNVDEACDGAEALNEIQSKEPDLVLSDWNMPNMTGIELLTNLRSSGCKVKFGFVTSEGTPEMRAKAVEAGALFLIAKPFSVEDFKDTINGALSGAIAS